jgi:DNA repair protein RecO (recombination protein O)
MAVLKTRVLTLRLTDFSETSQVVAVYSRNFGRMSLLAKGSRRKRRGTNCPIDLLQVLEIVFIDKGPSRLALLTESLVLEEFRGLRGDIRRGYAAFFVAELLSSVTEERDSAPELFDLAVETLGSLCSTKHPNVVVQAFEMRLLDLIGLKPRLDACAWCGGELGSNEEAAFGAEAGGAICPGCEHAAADRIRVSRGALAALNKLASSDPKRVERLRISGTIATDTRRILARLWMRVLGREPLMMKYLGES